jgi:integrase
VNKQRGSFHARVRIQRTLTCIDYGKPSLPDSPGRRRAAGIIRLTKVAVEALRGHLERQLWEKEALGDLYVDQGLVLTTAAGTSINSSNIRQRSLALLLKRASLPHIRFHDLRHTCATLLLSKASTPSSYRSYSGTPR